MKKQKTEKPLNNPELYFQILKECVINDAYTKAQISERLGISENHSSFSELRDLQFLRIFDNQGNRIELTPQGFSTYLAISSQKQSSENARKSLKFATWALIISASSFIASIIFNLLSCK